MEINRLYQLFTSNLSCIFKSLKCSNMILRKIIYGIFILGFLTGCTSPTAMLGPAYTLTSTGSVFQAGLSYGSNEMITMYTGKTPIENVKEIASKEKNIQKKTLESEDFYILVKNKIKNAKGIIKLPTQ